MTVPAICPRCGGRGFVDSVVRMLQHAPDCKGEAQATCTGEPPCSVVEIPGRAKCALCAALVRGGRRA